MQLPVAGLLRRLASTGGLMRAELVGAGVLPPLCCALVRYVQRARCSATTDEMLNVVAEICKTQNRTRVAAGCTEISRANRMAGELAAQLARAGQTTSSSRRRLCESLERTGVLSAALQALQVLALAPFLCCRTCMWQGMWISSVVFSSRYIQRKSSWQFHAVACFTPTSRCAVVSVQGWPESGVGFGDKCGKVC